VNEPLRTPDPSLSRRFEEKGWKLAGASVPVAYTAWSLWLVISGLVLLFA
jgi:hypothetical protein